MIIQKLEYGFLKLPKTDTYVLCDTKNVYLASTGRLSWGVIEHRAILLKKI